MMGQLGSKESLAHLSTNLSVLLLALGFQVAVPFAVQRNVWDPPVTSLDFLLANEEGER